MSSLSTITNNYLFINFNRRYRLHLYIYKVGVLHHFYFRNNMPVVCNVQKSKIAARNLFNLWVFQRNAWGGSVAVAAGIKVTCDS